MCTVCSESHCFIVIIKHVCCFLVMFWISLFYCKYKTRLFLSGHVRMITEAADKAAYCFHTKVVTPSSLQSTLIYGQHLWYYIGINFFKQQSIRTLGSMHRTYIIMFTTVSSLYFNYEWYKYCNTTRVIQNVHNVPPHYSNTVVASVSPYLWVWTSNRSTQCYNSIYWRRKK